jgi:hypothetical protein
MCCKFNNSAKGVRFDKALESQEVCVPSAVFVILLACGQRKYWDEVKSTNFDKQ